MSFARVVFFMVVVLAVLGGVNAHAFRWARNAWGLGKVAQRRLLLVLLLSLAAMTLGRVLSRFWPGAVVSSAVAVASTFQLAVVISVVPLLGADVAFWVARIVRRLRARRGSVPLERAAEPDDEGAPVPRRTNAAVSVAGIEVPRRTFMTQAAAGTAFLIGGSSSLYGALRGRSDYSVEEVPLKLPGLSRSLDGFTIAQLSDVHIGMYVGEPELRIACDLLRGTRPDLIVLTGDLLDNDPRLADQLGRFVRRLTPLARAGVVAILGNHDYFAGAEAVEAAVTGAGARLLRNQGIVLGSAAAGLALLGVDDVYARREGGGPDLQRTLRSLQTRDRLGLASADMPRVLLSHNPSFFAESAGNVGLQISGHTHGGQVNLGVRPAELFLPGGWVAGRYDEKGSTLYVNRGFGTVGPPARIGASPEVTRIVLTS